MIVSSRSVNGLWRGRRERTAVAQQCPEDVDQAAGQGEQGLMVAFALASLAGIEGAAVGAVQRATPTGRRPA